MAYETIILEIADGVGVLRLNRPQALNALNARMTAEIAAALDALAADDSVGCAILTGSEKAFAAGADIKEVKDRAYPEIYLNDPINETWESVARFPKPIIAAVSGYALGGGCELALMCDFVIAADSAKFGQPEITIGIMPGAGGTQRLARFIGKAKTMDLCLTGRTMDVEEAERCGLVSRIVPQDRLMEEALEAARKIASFSRPVSIMTKEAVNAAYETTLAQGVRFERRVFHAMFALEDQKEGMSAFAEKRPPRFRNR